MTNGKERNGMSVFEWINTKPTAKTWKKNRNAHVASTKMNPSSHSISIGLRKIIYWNNCIHQQQKASRCHCLAIQENDIKSVNWNQFHNIYTPYKCCSLCSTQEIHCVCVRAQKFPFASKDEAIIKCHEIVIYYNFGAKHLRTAKEFFHRFAKWHDYDIYDIKNITKTRSETLKASKKFIHPIECDCVRFDMYDGWMDARKMVNANFATNLLDLLDCEFMCGECSRMSAHRTFIHITWICQN